MKKFDVIVIGGGQSGLAVGYYLRRTDLSFATLDNQQEGGAAWLHAWHSLRLFSPAHWSSLPGMIMNGGGEYYPKRDEAIAYLKQYELKYNLPLKVIAKKSLNCPLESNLLPHADIIISLKRPEPL